MTSAGGSRPANGEILATAGQGYKAKADAKNGIESVQKAAGDPKANFEFFEDKKKEHRWRLKAANGQTIAAASEGYKAKADAEKAVDSFKAGAPKAEVVEIEGNVSELDERGSNERFVSRRSASREVSHLTSCKPPRRVVQAFSRSLALDLLTGHPRCPAARR